MASREIDVRTHAFVSRVRMAPRGTRSWPTTPAWGNVSHAVWAPSPLRHPLDWSDLPMRALRTPACNSSKWHEGMNMSSHDPNRTDAELPGATSVAAFALVCAFVAMAPASHVRAQSVHVGMGDGGIIAANFPAIDPNHPNHMILSHVKYDNEDTYSLFELRSLDAGAPVSRPWRVIIASGDEVRSFITDVRPATQRRWNRAIRDTNRALRGFVPLRAFECQWPSGSAVFCQGSAAMCSTTTHTTTRGPPAAPPLRHSQRRPSPPKLHPAILSCPWHLRASRGPVS